MKALLNYIKSRITTNLPAIKTVRLYNSQADHANGEKKDEKFFPTPAVFIEFIENEIFTRPLGIKDVVLTVRFRFSKVGYKFERPETFDFIDDFDYVIERMAPTTASNINFTTFQEIMSEYDEDHDNVENPYKDYRTQYRRTSGYQRRNDIIVNGINLGQIPVIFDNKIDFSQSYNSGLTTILTGF